MKPWEALRAVPRRDFIPDTIWTRRDDGWAVPVRRQDDPERWEHECQTDDSIIIQVDDGEAVDQGIWPTRTMDVINAMWRKSARSSEQGDACVEVAAIASFVAFRDSKDPDGPKLVMDRCDFRRFADALKEL